MYNYITVYKSNETNFEHNGLRILCPTSCQITETLNGEYSLSLTHPFDSEGNWKFLTEFNIIKCQGQLFRIYSKNTTVGSNGSVERSVEAMHIFYDLNFYFIASAHPFYRDCQSAIEWIMDHTYTLRKRDENGKAVNTTSPTSEFTFRSDLRSDDIEENIQYRHTAYYEKMSVAKAILGADNAIVNTWGGEILRDNFHFEVNKRRGKDNAFCIRYGADMLDITETVDYSSYCESIYWVGNFKSDAGDGEYSGVACLERIGMPILPVSPMKYLKLTLSEQDVNNTNSATIKAAFDKAAKDYMMTNCSPIINYNVSFADLRNVEKYKDFLNLQNYNLGDTGIIYNEELGINTTQQIVKKTIDGITGEVLSVDLGSLRKNFTSNGKVNGGYDSVRTELIKNELTFGNSWEDLGAKGYKLDDLSYSWDSLAGEVSMTDTEVI